MRTRTDEVCGACGSAVVLCDECDVDFCPSDHRAVDCPHGYADDEPSAETNPAARVPYVEVDQEWMPGDVVPYRMQRSVRVF